MKTQINLDMLKEFLVEGSLRLDFGREDTKEKAEPIIQKLKTLGNEEYEINVRGPANGIYVIDFKPINGELGK